MARDAFDVDRDVVGQFRPGYRAVVYPGGTEDWRVVLLEAASDTEAHCLAEEAAGSFSYELWDAHVMIARFDLPS